MPPENGEVAAGDAGAGRDQGGGIPSASRMALGPLRGVKGTLRDSGAAERAPVAKPCPDAR